MLFLGEEEGEEREGDEEREEEGGEEEGGEEEEGEEEINGDLRGEKRRKISLRKFGICSGPNRTV